MAAAFFCAHRHVKLLLLSNVTQTIRREASIKSAVNCFFRNQTTQITAAQAVIQTQFRFLTAENGRYVGLNGITNGQF